ncbi:MAG: glutaredoxin family protein [Thiobacillus sp.]|nr:glutaredoxin family protein [Thiobacillus sp.]
MKAGFIMAAVWIATASAPLAAAQLYQWKDAQGRMMYSDQPPPASVKNAQQKSFKGNLIESGESYATKTAREKFPITLYASACGAPCDQARKLLTDRGAPFSNKDPQASPDAQAELKKLTGKLSVPVLVVGSDRIDGFETEQWNAALDRAGYPKSTLPGSKPAPAAAAPKT